MHLAYKHLESKLRIGELTVGQWAGALGGLGALLAWGFYVSPLPATPTIVSAVYLGGLPIAFALVAGYAELDLVLLLGCAARWRRGAAVHLPGPGTRARGYAIHPDRDARAQTLRGALPALDLEALWEH
jgi:hypothetical protein